MEEQETEEDKIETTEDMISLSPAGGLTLISSKYDISQLSGILLGLLEVPQITEILTLFSTKSKGDYLG